MQRSHAFMLSAFLTVLVTGAFFALAGQARARSAAQPEPVEVAAAAADAPYLAQEQALQTNIAQLQQTLASMNTEYSKKVQTAQSNMEIGQEAISAREAVGIVYRAGYRRAYIVETRGSRYTVSAVDMRGRRVFVEVSAYSGAITGKRYAWR